MVYHNDIEAYLVEVEKEAESAKLEFEAEKAKLADQLETLTDEFMAKEAVFKAKIEVCNKLLEKDLPEDAPAADAPDAEQAAPATAEGIAA